MTLAPNVPSYHQDNDSSYSGNGTNLTDKWHNEKLMWGKGDPCRLAGLSTATARAMTDEQLQAYDSGWRVQTNSQVLAFSGQGGGDLSAYYIPSTGTADEFLPAGTWTGSTTYSAPNMGVARFPKANADPRINAGNVAIPASGMFTENGTVTNQQSGYYWEYTFYNASFPRHMYIHQTNFSYNSSNKGAGLSLPIRCVPQDL